MLRGRPLADLTWADILALRAEGVQEGPQLDFKGVYERSRDGERRLIISTDEFRRKIARTLMAFANADGGSVVIGQDELRGDDGKPKPDGVAGELQAFPNPQGECDRLLRSMADLIEPRLGIEDATVINPATGLGVVVLSVGRSAMRPHASTKRDEVAPVRSGREARSMGIREIKDMTLAAARELEGHSAKFAGLMRAMYDLAHNRPSTQVGFVGALASPLTALRVGDLSARSPYASGDFPIRLNGEEATIRRIGAYSREMRPFLHGLRGHARGSRSHSSMTLRFDGSCQVEMEYADVAGSDGRPKIPLQLFEREVMLAAADAATNALVLRSLAGDDTTEIGLKLVIADRGRANVQGWSQDGSDDDGLRLIDRQNDFEVRRFANPNEAAICLHEIRTDFWRALGYSKIENEEVEFLIEKAVATAFRRR